MIDKIKTSKMQFKMVSSRGLTVWPESSGLPYSNDQWRCRFLRIDNSKSLIAADVIELFVELNKAGLEVIKHETLCSFDGIKGFSMGQGE
jgi:isocitrate dehydrogenase